MKHAKAVVSLLVVAGGIALAGPAQAAVVTRHLHFVYRPAATKDVKVMSSSDAADKGLDCADGTFTADGADVASTDITSEADGSGGCKVTAAVDDGVKTFVARFNAAGGGSHTYTHTFARDEAIKSSIDILEK